MKVLLTGGSGFIGTNLIKYFLKKEYQVGVILRSESKFGFDFKNVSIYISDSKIDSLKLALEDFKPELVIHLATYYSYKVDSLNLDKMINSNISFGTHLLEAMVATGVQNIINIGTSFEHYNNEDYNPVNLYAAFKHSFQNILTYYVKSNQLNAITIKLFDSYGEGDSRNKIISLIRDSLNNGRLLKLSPGLQILDLLHVNDICSAIGIASKQLLQGNIGLNKSYALSGERISLKDLVELMEQLAGRMANIQWAVYPYREREVMMPWSNFMKLPGWQHQIKLEEGIRAYLSEAK